MSLMIAVESFSPHAPAVWRSNSRLAARPADATEEEWEVVVEAERVSRAKKYGPAAQAMEVMNKEMIEKNQLLIWEEFSRRRGSAPAPPRASRRKKTKGFAPSSSAAPRSAAPAPLPEAPAAPAPAPAPAPGFLGRLAESAKQLYDEADAMGYASAVAVSADLENRGILPRVVTAERDADAESTETQEGLVAPAAPADATAPKQRGLGSTAPSKKKKPGKKGRRK